MSTFLPALLNLLQQYGYPVLWVAVFVGAIGIPLPISLTLLAMGAFAALGDFNIVLLVILALMASVCGDNVGYFIGRRWGSKLLNWLAHPKRQRFISPHTVERSRAYFNRRGGWAVFLTRFLFTALGSVTNLLAGIELLPYRHFLFADVPGEALGVTIPLSLGFIFAASWEAVGDIVGTISLLALALLVVIFLIYRLVKMTKGPKATESHPENELVRVQKNAPGKADITSNTTTSDQLPL